MKTLLSLFFFMLASISLTGQYILPTIQLDSLTQLLAKADKDSLKHDLHFELGKAYQFVYPNKAVIHLTESITLARKMGDKKRLWSDLVTLGFLYSSTGEPAKSMVLLQEALHLSEAVNEGANMPLAFIANNYEAQGDFNNALEYAKRAYQIYGERYKLGLKVDERGYVTTPMRLGQLFEKTGRLDSAMYYAQMSYQRLLEKPSVPLFPRFYGSVCTLLGNLYSQLNDSKQAVIFYHLALNKGIETNYPYSVNESQSALATFYYKKHQPDSAIYYAMQAYEGAKKIKDFSIMKESSALLRSVNEQEKDFENALYYNDLSIAARDSISGAEKVREVQTLTHKEEQRQLKILQDMETERIAYKNRIKMYALLSILGGLLLMAFILYRNNRQKQKANVLLQEQKEKVESTLAELKTTQAQLIQKEKLASLGELTAGIAHEIQNPLNFVNNFSELSVDLVKDLKEEIEKPAQDKEYIGELFDDLSQNQEKINHHGKRASSIVKGMLEHSRASTGVKELTDINTLADEYFRLSYHGMRAKDKDFNATMETHFQDPLSKIEIIPQDIGRVLLNLINNAFYAVHQRKLQLCEGLEPSQSLSTYTPSVSVTTQQIDNQTIIKVKDNGMGMPESVRAKVFQPFFTTKPTGQGTGLGLSLAYDIVTKGHGGSLEVESTEGVGTEFIIKI